MKNKKCPERKHCFGYKDGYCDGCAIGDEITRLHKRIDRLKKQKEKLTINMNAYGLTAKIIAEENERLRAEEKQSQILIKTLHDKLDEGYAKFVDEERAIAAGEIFEEIEKALDNSVETEHFKGTWFNFSKFKQRLAELKKKFTEDEG